MTRLCWAPSREARASWSEAIPARIGELETEALILGKAREAEGVGQEGQHDVATIDRHTGVGIVRLGIPAVVQLSEVRRLAHITSPSPANPSSTHRAPRAMRHPHHDDTY